MPETTICIQMLFHLPPCEVCGKPIAVSVVRLDDDTPQYRPYLGLVRCVDPHCLSAAAQTQSRFEGTAMHRAYQVWMEDVVNKEEEGCSG